MNKIISLIVFFTHISVWADVPVHKDRNEAEYSNQYAVVLNGYDPVTYFSEGGGTPQKGQPTIAFTYGQRMYHFVSPENRDLFKSNPLKYEPTYGSWCAYAMARGSKVRINPLIFTVAKNRSHFFISRSAKNSFDEDLRNYEDNADQVWFDFSGEAPRL